MPARAAKTGWNNARSGGKLGPVFTGDRTMTMVMKSAVLTSFLLAAATTAAPDASAADVGPARGAGRAAECKRCKFESSEGATNCWSCGTRVPGSEDPRKLLPGKLIVVNVAAKGKVGGTAEAGPDSSSEVKAVEKWIDANPGDYAGALKRLGPLLDAVRGRVYEARVEDHISRIRGLAEEASRPMTKEEREKRAASMVIDVVGRVRKRTDRHAQNVRELGTLLAIAKGTSYEGMVRRLLKAEKAKLNR